MRVLEGPELQTSYIIPTRQVDAQTKQHATLEPALLINQQVIKVRLDVRLAPNTNVNRLLRRRLNTALRPLRFTTDDFFFSLDLPLMQKPSPQGRNDDTHRQA